MKGLHAKRKIATRRELPWTFALVISTVCTSALGQSQPGASTQAATLFDEAKLSMAKGNFAEACPKLARSQELDPQVGTLLNLALCYENEKKAASACPTWLAAATAAERRHQSEREDFALEGAQRNCAKAQRVIIDVAPQPARDRIEVRVNDARLSREQWGLLAPLDPGEYELRATAQGLQPWRKKMVVDEDRPTVVTVPVLLPVANAPEPPNEAGRASSARTRALTYGALAAAGAGVIAVGIGAAFATSALLARNASNEGHNCVSNVCNPEGANERWNARRDERNADIAFAIGAGGLAAGLVLWVLRSHSAAAESRGVTVHALVGMDRWSLSVGHAWQ